MGGHLRGRLTSPATGGGTYNTLPAKFPFKESIYLTATSTSTCLLLFEVYSPHLLAVVPPRRSLYIQHSTNKALPFQICACPLSACLVGYELTVNLRIQGGVCVLARQVAAAAVAAAAAAVGRRPETQRCEKQSRAEAQWRIWAPMCHQPLSIPPTSLYSWVCEERERGRRRPAILQSAQWHARARIHVT